MAEVEKQYYNFSKGINTEASLIDFPNNFSSDEANYELFIDSSRRKRKGFDLEIGGVITTLTTSISGSNAARTFKWHNVSGDSTKNFIIVQLGAQLHFYTDVTPLSLNKLTFQIDLLTQKVPGTSDSLVANSQIDIAYGRGHAFVVGKYIEPFWIKYDVLANNFTVTQIFVQERDFEGIDDGVDNITQPVTETTSHTYNLFNRGWTKTNLTTYRAAQPTEPSKNMLMWLGYRRSIVAGFAENDGTKQFSDAKLIAELFQDATAPQGHFIRNPFNTTTVNVPGGATSSLAISTWSISATTPGTQTITVTTDGNHGLAPTNIVKISGQSSTYQGSGYPGFFLFNFNGDRTVVATPTAITFTFTITFVSNFIAWQSQFQALGTVNTQLATNPSGFSSTVRPECAAFFAGRLWFAGTGHERLSSKLFFSQIIESTAQYGKCYQVADPTDERISDILPSDGGTMVIPDITGVHKIQAYGSVLLIFGLNGVWQIGPGESGYFTATGYSVRKITDRGSTNGMGVVFADDVPYFLSQHDVFRLIQDENSGFLVAQNISELVIHTLYNKISDLYKQNMQGEYDTLNKRIIWLYGECVTDTCPVTFTYNRALILDLRLGAFTKWMFPFIGANVKTLVNIKDNTGFDKQIKYIVITTPTILKVCELNRIDFRDFEFADVNAFLLTGPETFVSQEFGRDIKDSAKYKHAPYVWVFSKKTETGYTAVLNDLVPIGESSTKMQARWDWADRSAAGKWGQQQEVYRHRRLYQPTGITDTFDDGTPVVITKNKVRGRGRALQLLFTAGIGKDSWLMGWQTKYQVNT